VLNDFLKRTCTSDKATGLRKYMGHHSSRRQTSWNARLQPSQKTIALLFSPSDLWHMAHVESSDGMPAKSGLGIFLAF